MTFEDRQLTYKPLITTREDEENERHYGRKAHGDSDEFGSSHVSCGRRW
jgi:hypothetical protein